MATDAAGFDAFSSPSSHIQGLFTAGLCLHTMSHHQVGVEAQGSIDDNLEQDVKTHLKVLKAGWLTQVWMVMQKKSN